MPYEAHSELITPPDETIIWRYLNIAKLLDLFERRVLWFARVDTFEDPLEGTHTDAEIEYLRSRPNLPAPFPSMEEQYVSMTKMFRQTMFVNCWRSAPSESMAMWDIYGKGGEVVAIKSTIGRLKESLATHPLNVFIGNVKYVDWGQLSWHMNALAMVMRKGSSYEHEREVRAVVWGIGPQGGEPPIVSSSFTDEGRYVFHGPLGLEIAIEPERLIAEIMIGPREQAMLQKLLGPVLRRYNLEIPVTASDRLKPRHTDRL